MRALRDEVEEVQELDLGGVVPHQGNAILDGRDPDGSTKLIRGEQMSQRSALVTGGSGYLGSWIIIELLRRDWSVCATIRRARHGEEVQKLLGTIIDPMDRLRFVQADLLEDDGWDEAADGADHVIHVASPMPVGEFAGQDVIRPAREGTARVLGAAIRAKAKSVVLTSSIEAARPGSEHQGPVDESCWTDPDEPELHQYARSKVLAEQDAWAKASEGRMPLTTILAGSIQGPVRGPDFAPSVGLIRALMLGRLPMPATSGFPIVDVRDLAALHVDAMTDPSAHDQRFVAAGEFLSIGDIAALLRGKLGAAASKVPELLPRTDTPLVYSSAKAERLLGWKHRSAETAVLASANSLIAHHLV